MGRASARNHRQRDGCPGFGLLGSATLIGRYTPPKAKYRGGRPIAYKYRKGKMQSTLKRERKELEVVGREAIDHRHRVSATELLLLKKTGKIPPLRPDRRNSQRVRDRVHRCVTIRVSRQLPISSLFSRTFRPIPDRPFPSAFTLG